MADKNLGQHEDPDGRFLDAPEIMIDKTQELREKIAISYFEFMINLSFNQEFSVVSENWAELPDKYKATYYKLADKRLMDFKQWLEEQNAAHEIFNPNWARDRSDKYSYEPLRLEVKP